MTRNRLFVRNVSLAAFLTVAAYGGQVAYAQAQGQAKFKKKEIEVSGGTQTELT